MAIFSIFLPKLWWGSARSVKTLNELGYKIGETKQWTLNNTIFWMENDCINAKTGAKLMLRRDATNTLIGLYLPGARYRIAAQHDAANRTAMLELADKISPEIRQACLKSYESFDKTGAPNKTHVGKHIVSADKSGLVVESDPPVQTHHESSDKNKDDAKDKKSDRQPWQDNFEELAKELDKVGPLFAKALNNDHEGKPVAWKLNFVGFQNRGDKILELEFDLIAYGIVEPKKAKGLEDKAWKRPIMMAFEPAPDALKDWKKLETGTEVMVHGVFKKAFWVRLNDTRDFAIVDIGEVTIGKKGVAEKDAPKKEDAKSGTAPKKLEEIIGDWGKADLSNVTGLRLEIEADGTCWTSYLLLMGNDRFEATATSSKLKGPPFRVPIAKQSWEIKLNADGSKLLVVSPDNAILVLPKLKVEKKK